MISHLDDILVAVMTLGLFIGLIRRPKWARK
jgi:hypothetical protein